MCVQLPGLYHDLCNHPSLPLDQRRATEHKLFLFHFSLLAALPTTSPMKPIARGEVLEMTRGCVLLGIEDQQMWEVEIEWGDWQVIGELVVFVFWFSVLGLVGC